ncbi:hypothetical protein ACKWTF_012999 [Chironomus riparius]
MKITWWMIFSLFFSCFLLFSYIYRHYEHNDGVSITFVLEMLEQLDRKHARTPRFGKRGNNDYLTKEYTNNVLRFILENPEYFQHLQQQESS